MKHQCPRCKYEWESRIRKPKCCPYCKNYLPLLKYQLNLKKKREENKDEWDKIKEEVKRNGEDN